MQHHHTREGRECQTVRQNQQDTDDGEHGARREIGDAQQGRNPTTMACESIGADNSGAVERLPIRDNAGRHPARGNHRRIGSSGTPGLVRPGLVGNVTCAPGRPQPVCTRARPHHRRGNKASRDQKRHSTKGWMNHKHQHQRNTGRKRIKQGRHSRAGDGMNAAIECRAVAIECVRHDAALQPVT